MTLTEFLLARIAEDEAVFNSGWSRGVLDPGASNLENHWPAERLLAECESKREIVGLHPEAVARGLRAGAAWAHDETLRRLALAYADHPEYQQEWRP